MRNPVNLLLLLFLITFPITTRAQTPPPLPPMPMMNQWLTNSWVTNTLAPIPNPTFSVTCPNCKIKLGKYHAITIKTNGWHKTPDGMIIYDRTISFKCPGSDCQKPFEAANQKVVPEVPETIAVEDSDVPTAQTPVTPVPGASVLPDTNAPVISNFALSQTNITFFTNLVPITAWSVYSGGPSGPNFYWIDPVTGQQVTKAFNLRFTVKSNNYYTAWYTSTTALNNWREYPTPIQLHPARGDYISGISVPIWGTNVFYTVRSFTGTNRITWN